MFRPAKVTNAFVDRNIYADGEALWSRLLPRPRTIARTHRPTHPGSRREPSLKSMLTQKRSRRLIEFADYLQSIGGFGEPSRLSPHP